MKHLQRDFRHPNFPHSKRGFTLIELIIVIVIIGVVSVIALPRLANISEDAHRASVDGVHGALVSAVTLVHAQWIAKAQPEDVDNLPGFGQEDVNLSDDGWPVGTTGTDNSATMTVSKCIEIWDSLMIDQAPTVGTSVNVDYGVAIGATSTQCLYTYQGGGVTTRTITYDAATGAMFKNNAG